MFRYCCLIFLCCIKCNFIYGEDYEMKDFNDSYLQVIKDAYKFRNSFSDEFIFKAHCVFFFPITAIFSYHEVSRKIFLNNYFYIIFSLIYICSAIYDEFELISMGGFTGISSVFFGYSLYKYSFKDLKSYLFLVNTCLFSIMFYFVLVRKKRKSTIKYFNNRLDIIYKLSAKEREILMYKFIGKVHKDVHFDIYSVSYNLKIFESMISAMIYGFINGLNHGFYWKFYCNHCEDFILIDKKQINMLFC